MTAYVLGTRPPLPGRSYENQEEKLQEQERGNKQRTISNESNKTEFQNTADNPPILQIGNDDLQTLKMTSDPDIDEKA